MANKYLRYSRLEIAELCLKYKDNPDSLPDLTTSEICRFVKDEDKISKYNRFNDFLRHFRAAGVLKQVPGVTASDIDGEHYMVNIIQIWPFLLERKCVSVDLFDYCNELLGTKQPKHLRPFTSEYFEQIFAVGSIIMIRFNKSKNIKRVQLTEIIYRPDSISEISAVTFGSQSYTLEELKDNLEYFQNDHWLPFGFYE